MESLIKGAIDALCEVLNVNSDHLIIAKRSGEIESAAVRERNDLRRQLQAVRVAFEPLHRALYPDSWNK